MGSGAVWFPGMAANVEFRGLSVLLPPILTGGFSGSLCAHGASMWTLQRGISALSLNLNAGVDVKDPNPTPLDPNRGLVDSTCRWTLLVIVKFPTELDFQLRVLLLAIGVIYARSP